MLDSPKVPKEVQPSSKVLDGAHLDKPQQDKLKIRNSQWQLQCSTVLVALILFRLINSFSNITFFQPDEFFQSLEPAWNYAFGPDSGAWITWEWVYHLRSAFYPLIFAYLYKAVESTSSLCRLNLHYEARFLLAAPKVAQALCAAAGDFYTWQLACRVYGDDHFATLTTLLLSVTSPWNWFCATRTFSNSFETTLTVAALSHWPWQWSNWMTTTGPHHKAKSHISSENAALPSPEAEPDAVHDSKASHGQTSHLCRSDVPLPETQKDSGTFFDTVRNPRLQKCLVLAGSACILRPTNLLIWTSLVLASILGISIRGHRKQLSALGLTCLVPYPFIYSKWTYAQVFAFVLNGVLTCSMLVDFHFYRAWTFPPFQFFHFNLAQSLAAIYGKNRWDYYFTEGLPLLLTASLPFALYGLYSALQGDNDSSLNRRNISSAHARYCLALTTCFLITALSLVSHKEARFIYPLLPLLQILAARPFLSFLLSSLGYSTVSLRRRSILRIALCFLICINMVITVFASKYHQVAPIKVMDYLRGEYLSQSGSYRESSTHSRSNLPPAMTVGFLMPCHSTPWRSHLVFANIHAWALSCEPPVDMNSEQRSEYIDEADRFYLAPTLFLNNTLGPPPTSERQSEASKMSKLWKFQIKMFLFYSKSSPAAIEKSTNHSNMWSGRSGSKGWPQYLVFFEEKETLLGEVLKNSSYQPCWRAWNSYFHDDWRRRGDILVWCIRDRARR